MEGYIRVVIARQHWLTPVSPHSHPRLGDPKCIKSTASCDAFCSNHRAPTTQHIWRRQRINAVTLIVLPCHLAHFLRHEGSSIQCVSLNQRGSSVASSRKQRSKREAGTRELRPGCHPSAEVSSLLRRVLVSTSTGQNTRRQKLVQTASPP